MTQGFSIAVSKPGATEPSKSRWALRAVSIVVVISILNLFVFTRNINNSAPAASFQSLEREQHVAVLGTLPSQAPVSNSSTNVTLPAHYPRISNSTSIYMNGSQAINSAIQTETSAEVSNDSEMANSTTLIDSFNASAPESDKLIIMEKFNAGSRSNSDFTSDLERRWAEAIQQATSLIYRSSGKETLEYWLSQPPPRIYIYDELPNDFTDMETVSTCVDRKFLGKNYSDWPNCPWRPTKPCEDGDRGRSQKQKMFMAARYNYNTDVAYIDKFLQYPFVTTDPKEADMFIVPYPHKSHCLCNKDFKLHSAKCSVSFSDIKSKVLDQLTHFHKKDSNYRRRHLFFLGADYEQGLRPLRQAVYGSMTLSLGPAVPCKEKKSSCGHFSVPYLTTDPDYQPSVLAGIDDETWATREREYSVGAALSAPKALALRGEFLKQWKDWIGESIQGKPNKIFNMGQQRSGKKSRFFMNLYRNSTLCVILPGDGCAQKRFFDTIMNGCIPIVPLFDSNDGVSPHSFHHQNGCSTRITYPLARGSFFGNSMAGFNMMDLVVTFNATCGLRCMKGAINSFLENATKVEEKRRLLKDYALATSLDLSEYPTSLDTFTSTIVALRHHLWDIMDRTSTELPT